MKEHYGLSQAQLRYLNGQDMPKSFNVSKEKKRIKNKAEQAWSIFLPILNSKIVDPQYKDEIFSHSRFETFLNELIKTERSYPASQEINKMNIAKMMIQKGFSFYQTRFELNPIINDEIQKIWSLLEMVQSLVDQELRNLKQADIIRMRKGQIHPPIIKRDEFYHARCVECWAYDLNISHSAEDVVFNITHNDGCGYLLQAKDADHFKHQVLNEQFIQIFLPKTKN